MDPALGALVDALIATATACHARGEVPATSGNLSARLGPELVVITASGRHKGLLRPDDLLLVTLAGEVVGTVTGRPPERPSAETDLHLRLYRRSPAVGAVVHTHGPAATVISRRAADAVRLRDYELLKAIDGVRTHEADVRVPVFPNTQDVVGLADVVEAGLAPDGPPACLIRGHGLYAWGPDLHAAGRHAEALEFLFRCELLGEAR